MVATRLGPPDPAGRRTGARQFARVWLEELAVTANGLKVAIALSAGTARSIAHVGVLKALEEEGIGVDLIAGTSGGALIGALYAGGIGIRRLEEIACHARWRDFAGLVLPRMGFLSSEGIGRFLVRQIGDPDFSELMMPLGIVTTDLLSGEKVVITDTLPLPPEKQTRSKPVF